MTERIRITLNAELRSALHILGPGRTVALVDRPTELDIEGYPLIPASTMRGRLRAHLERLLRAWGQMVCTPPVPEHMCPHIWPIGGGPADGYCVACHIFGSPWYSAGIATGDLRLIEAQRSIIADLLRTERTSVSISRRLGTAQSERLFTLEATVPDLAGQPLTFEGEMVGRLTPQEAGWLLAAVPLVVHAGGGKARGLGELRLSATAVAWWRNNAWESADGRKLQEEALAHAPT